MTDEKQPFFSHLKELRDRLVVCIIAVAIAFILTYYFKERLFYFLMQPFVRVMPAQSSFIFTGITEAFITYFKISIVAALFVAAPVILYEFWMFVAPGLYENEKKYVYPFIFSGSLCFILGALFCYFIVIPLVAFYLSRAGIINARMLAKKRRYAILSVFIISAIITPPDVVSMVLVALPLWGLFELGILIAKVFGKKEAPHETA